MEKILFIAFQFYPRGGPGVHRSINFVKYLTEFGYDPIVLTTDEATIKTENAKLDYTLLTNPSDYKIERVGITRWIFFIKILFKIKLFRIVWTLFFPLFRDWYVVWAYKTFSVAKELIKKIR